MRWEARNAQFSGEQSDLTQWVSEVRGRFLADKFATTMPRWGERSLKEGKLCAACNHPKCLGKGYLHLFSRIPRMDGQQIQATFASVFLPAQATDDLERARFFEFWDQALVMCLAGTRFFDEKGDEIPAALTEAGRPYDYDSWILRRLAVVVGQMRLDEKPERYWRPILALGARAGHWVEDFLDYWFMDAKKSLKPATFVQEWTRMIEFCLGSEAWTEQGEHVRFHMPFLWMCLMGIPRFTTSLWQDKDAEIVEQASDHIAKVSTHVLTSANSAVRFLSWLSKSSAKGIRGRLLKPVADVGLTASDCWWRERHLARVMARFLGLVWDEHASNFEKDAEHKKIFLSLVHRTAKTQEPLAMELQNRMAARN